MIQTLEASFFRKRCCFLVAQGRGRGHVAAGRPRSRRRQRMWTEAKSLSLQVKRSRWGNQPKAREETAISLERSSTEPPRWERRGRWWSWAGGTCRSTPYGRARHWRHLPRKSLQHYAVWLLCSAGGSQVSSPFSAPLSHTSQGCEGSTEFGFSADRVSKNVHSPREQHEAVTEIAPPAGRRDLISSLRLMTSK